MVAETLRIQVEADTKDAQRGLSSVQKQSKNAAGGMQGAASSAGGLMGALKAIGPAGIAAGAGLAAIGSEIKQGLKAWSEYEAAAADVEASLAIQGENVDDLLPKYEAFASRIDDVTAKSDKQALQLVTLANNFGVAESEITNVVEGAIGLEQALGINAERAVRQITRAMEGNTSSLQRYIPELENAGSESEKLAIINEKMSEGFEQAELGTEALEDKQARLATATRDVRQAVGEFVSGPAGSLIDWAENAASGVANLVTNMGQYLGLIEESTDEERDSIRRLESEIETYEKNIESARGQIEDLVRVGNWEENRDELRRQIIEWQNLITEREKNIENIREEREEERQNAAEEEKNAERRRKAEKEISEIRSDYENQLRVTQELEQAGVISAEQKWKRQQSAAEGYLESLAEIEKLGAQDTATEQTLQFIEELEQNLQDLESTSDRAGAALGDALAISGIDKEAFAGVQEAISEAQRQSQQEAMEANEAWARAIGQGQEDMAKSNEAAKAMQQELRQEFLQTVNQYAQHAQTISSMGSEMWSQINANQQRQTQNEIQRLREEGDALEERHKREIEWMELAGATREEIEKRKLEQKEEEAEAEEKKQKKIAELEKRQFKRERRQRVSESIMNTAVGVTRALASANYVEAGIIGSLGAVQTGIIAAEEPPSFERGGSFETNGEQIIRVGDGQSPRERVTVEPLSGPHTGRAGGGDNITVNISGVIGDKERVANWMHEAIRRGQERGKIRR